MFFIIDFAILMGKNYDRLNAWSFAGIICLLYKPLSVFDGGFLLSFTCVLCIFMFSKSVQELFNKWHFPNWLSSSLSVMIPVQFGFLPLLSQYFSKISLFSIIVNLICIPIFQIFFIMLFVSMPIVLILPACAWLLVIPNLTINLLMCISEFFAGIGCAIINISAMSAILIICVYLFLFICSHFILCHLKS